MRREQVAAVQVLVAILLPKPELIDPCIEKLCATAKGAQYLDAIKGVLLESMHTPQRSHRIKWDPDLCEIVRKLGIEYDHNTPNDESRYFHLPAEEPSRIYLIRARVRLMLTRSSTNYVFADPKDVAAMPASRKKMKRPLRQTPPQQKKSLLNRTARRLTTRLC